MVTNHFEKQLEKGNETEILIERVLQNYGWFTVPTYDYRGEKKKSPRAICNDKKIVLPDLDCFQNGIRIWVECKHEEGATWTYSLKRFDHGFQKKYYDHYLDIQRITGTPVWIFFLEKDHSFRIKLERIKGEKYKRSMPEKQDYPNNVLRGQRIDKLPVRITDKGSNYRNNSYIYFPQDSFFYFGVVTDTFFLVPISPPEIKVETLDKLKDI